MKGRVKTEFFAMSSDFNRMTDDVWSRPEKDCLCKFVKASPALHFPLKNRKTASGIVEQVYFIPKSEKYEVIKGLWPFEDKPKPGQEFKDVHSDQIVKVEDLMVIRWNERNMVVAPDYFKTGGMAVDLVDPNADDDASFLVSVFSQNIETKEDTNA